MGHRSTAAVIGPRRLAALVFGAAAALLCAQPAVPARAGANSATIAFSGDTHGYNIIDNEALGGHDLLAGVRDALGSADVFVFNHEGTLIDAEDRAASCRTFDDQSTFAVDPAFAQRIEFAGPAIATLANNHSMDCGPAGLAQTKAAMAKAGVHVVGAGSNLAEACRPLELSVDGVPFAFLSYLVQDEPHVESIATAKDPGVATIAACNAEAQVRGLATDHVVVVAIHVHIESSWRYGVAADHLRAAKDLLRWGADAVVSSGPHFPQAVMQRGGGAILFGLGNFMFQPGYRMPMEAHRSVLALVRFAPAGLVETRVYPVELLADGTPLLGGPPFVDFVQSLIDRLSDPYLTEVLPRGGYGLVRSRSGG
jgi:hypothetical protein